ncbi:hypothetical protein PDE_00744 [Penicillium oxalicum 114-2]|uniref:Uncharacterized protein n=1 Tax=Penicillium oxalicum (strain 114-2 / CGMCC 5302) TaxID=933388 RepID=S8AJ68_PENO1|nr:hypothetical protein PDE_00744 [Penicillium oxalicum 114-2]
MTPAAIGLGWSFFPLLRIRRSGPGVTDDTLHHVSPTNSGREHERGSSTAILSSEDQSWALCGPDSSSWKHRTQVNLSDLEPEGTDRVTE